MHARVRLNEADSALNGVRTKKHVFHLNFILKATAEFRSVPLAARRGGGAGRGGAGKMLACLLSAQNKAARASDD